MSASFRTGMATGAASAHGRVAAFVILRLSKLNEPVRCRSHRRSPRDLHALMSNAAKTKKKAIELEQKKQFDKALALYIQFLQESEGALDDADIPLYNRVGDLMT